ncbi:MAG: hypothetical protein ACJAU1_001395 [Psychromonas sp.]|jgi:hypothetical protein
MCKYMISKVTIIKIPVSINIAFSDSAAKDLLSFQAEYMLNMKRVIPSRGRINILFRNI